MLLVLTDDPHACRSDQQSTQEAMTKQSLDYNSNLNRLIATAATYTTRMVCVRARAELNDE